MKAVKMVFCTILFLSSATYAQSVLNDPSFIAEGGRLYDKWWAEYNLEKPSTTHPAYPKAGKKTGASTWRCKECHGWDYVGKDGRYSSGSHYTGFEGVWDQRSEHMEDVLALYCSWLFTPFIACFSLSGIAAVLIRILSLTW